MDAIDAILELQRAVTELTAKNADIEAKFERMFRPGKVTDVDAAKQLYRQEIGLDKDGAPVKGPWIPYSQVAGARKVHSPPSVGQQMMMISPDGDPAQAFGVPLTWSNENASPSQDKDTVVDDFDGTTITRKGGVLTLKASTIVLDGTAKLGGAGASRELVLRDSIDSAGDVMTSNLSTKVTAL